MPVSDVEVVGGWRTQTSSEVRPWAIDLTAELDPSDVVASATATLTDLLTGSDFPDGLSGSSETAITAPHVTQTVLGLVAGHNYRLVLTVNVGGSKRTSTVLLLTCPF